MQNDKKYYSVGGVTFAVNAPEPDEKNTLSLFRTSEETADIEVDITYADEVTPVDGVPVQSRNYESIYIIGDKTVRAIEDEVEGGLLLTDTYSDRRAKVIYRADRTKYLSQSLIIKLIDIPRRILDFEGIFLHSSFIEVNGEAILFTANKQVGKSTQASLWEKHRGAKVINGDRALLRRRDGRWFAYGSPYCGTSHICHNASMPVKAIVILSQAKESTAARATVRQSFAAMLDGTTFDTWDQTSVSRAMKICGDIVSDVPFYTLSCLPDESAVIALENIL